MRRAWAVRGPRGSWEAGEAKVNADPALFTRLAAGLRGTTSVPEKAERPEKARAPPQSISRHTWRFGPLVGDCQDSSGSFRSPEVFKVPGLLVFEGHDS